MADLNAFIVGDLSTQYPGYWSVLESNDGDYTTGDTGKPLVIRHDNQVAGEAVNIHIWRWLSTIFGLNISTDYVGPPPSVWYSQTGARFGEDASPITDADDRFCKMSHGNTTYSQYYFFGYQEYVYVVVQNSATGIWRNFAFGHIDKIDDFTGGGFCCASFCADDNTYEDSSSAGGYTQFFDNYYVGVTVAVDNDRKHCSQIRMDDGLTLRYVLGTCEDTIDNGPGGTNWPRIFGPNDTYGFSGNPYYPSTTSNPVIQPFESIKLHNAPSTFGLTSPLVPIYHYINRGNDQRSLTGVLPHVFCLNIRDIVETSEIDIQGTPYVVFPASKKTSTSGQDGTNLPNSYRYGFCLEKII